MILSLFAYYFQAGDFLTSFLRLATSDDSRHPERTLLFSKTELSLLDIILFFIIIIQNFLLPRIHCFRLRWNHYNLLMFFRLQSVSCLLIIGSNTRISVSKLTYSAAEISEINSRSNYSNFKLSSSTFIKLSFLVIQRFSKQFL